MHYLLRHSLINSTGIFCVVHTDFMYIVIPFLRQRNGNNEVLMPMLSAECVRVPLKRYTAL